MRDIKEMLVLVAAFSLLTFIPVGMWRLADGGGLWVKLLVWNLYFILFTAALAENFLRKRGISWGDIGVVVATSPWRALAAGVCAAAVSIGVGWFGVDVLGFRSSGSTSLEAMVLKHMSVGGWQAKAFLSLFMLPIAVCEELVFRGLAFNYLRSRRGYWFAAAASSVIFAFMHVSPVRMVYTAVYGLAWVAAYRYGGGLLAPVIAHYLHNITVFYL